MDQNMDRSTTNVSSGNKVTDKISNVGRDAKNMISEAAGKIEVPEAVTQQLQALRDQSQIVLDRTEELVKQHPFYSILGAAAVGALVASFMSNRMISKSYQQ